MTKLFQRPPRARTMAATSAAGFSEKRATRLASAVNGAPGSIHPYSGSGRWGAMPSKMTTSGWVDAVRSATST